jgi:2-octaprenyl-6-methoxyphenol hydroxylase
MTFKAIVVGSGPTGLAAACLLAHDNIKTAIIAPEPPIDHRTTALMDPAIRMLKYIGIWPGDISQHCAPLKQLHIIDDTGNTVTAPNIEFASTELGLDAFGYNVPLASLVPAMKTRAIELGATFVNATAAKFENMNNLARITTSDDEVYEAAVILAADGANSTIRGAAGFKVESSQFDQSALTTSFAHSSPHDFISTEFHKSAGPFTTVPLPGNRSSLVWMGRPDRIDHLKSLSDADLAVEIQLETRGLFGRISSIGQRAVFAMRSQRAEIFAANRVMLIGEAAHQFPPIGAQGLNMSLRDAAHAADLILHADDPGSAGILSEYNRLRQSDVAPRAVAISWINASLLSELLPATLARVAALTAATAFPQLREFVMKQGMTPSQNVPFAMRAG